MNDIQVRSDDILAGSFVMHIVVSGGHRNEAFAAVREITEGIRRPVHVDLVETHERP